MYLNMISNQFYSSNKLKILLVNLIFIHKVLAINEETDIQPPNYNSIFDHLFLQVISTFENDITRWVLVNDKNEINYSLICSNDLELLSIACDSDYICRQKKINSLNNLKRILESLECFHVFLCLHILNIFNSNITKKNENPNHNFILGFQHVRDYAVRMISFFIYGKFVVNSWQLDFSMNVIDMVRLQNDNNESFKDILVLINDPSLLTSMNEFCENCKRSNQFFATFTSVLTKTYQDKLDPFRVSVNVKYYIKKILSRLKINCIIKMDRTSHMLIKKANQQEIEIDPDFEKKKQEFLKSLKLNKLEIKIYERNTANPKNGYSTIKDLGKRLQASNFYRACKRQPTTCGKSLLKKVMYIYKKKELILTDESKNNLSNVNYGKINEEVAIKEFKKKTNIEIEPCGVFIDENLNYLIASPDGLIGSDGIVEVKCPFNAKDMTPKIAITEKIIKYVHFDKNGNLLLKRTSQEFYQIQGELHITQREYCYLIIWTGKGMVYEKIMRDDVFWKNNMENQLINFYENCMLPELINSQLFENNVIQTS
ncbi:uncharacterized protein LOC126893858 [Daktulosphaira vitifoliae]|uniref:uncharacterized protein LOC126893858 n=1 Tax=Daktulosphaira vitifoliae TaxID=58002 RepID=UPI0021AA3807|nr:uncharacterized protein LOC126893858 [Daktulosphaira vitifoliae]